MKNEYKNQKLKDRLKSELGNISDEALRFRLQRRANKLGLSTAEALIVIAAELGIGYQIYLKKLPLESQSRIHTVISKNGIPQSAVVYKDQKRINLGRITKRIKRSKWWTFKVWCNENQGLLEVIGLIVTLSIAIIGWIYFTN